MSRIDTPSRPSRANSRSAVVTMRSRVTSPAPLPRSRRARGAARLAAVIDRHGTQAIVRIARCEYPRPPWVTSSRRSVQQLAVTGPPPCQPAIHRALGHALGGGSLRHPPTLLHHTLDQQHTTRRDELGVSVKLHRCPPWDCWLQAPPVSKEARADERLWDLQLVP